MAFIGLLLLIIPLIGVVSILFYGTKLGRYIETLFRGRSNKSLASFKRTFVSKRIFESYLDEFANLAFGSLINLSAKDEKFNRKEMIKYIDFFYKYERNFLVNKSKTVDNSFRGKHIQIMMIALREFKRKNLNKLMLL